MSLDFESWAQLIGFAVAFYVMYVNFTQDPF